MILRELKLRAALRARGSYLGHKLRRLGRAAAEEINDRLLWPAFWRQALKLQHDQNVANGDGATVRADLNNALVSLFSTSSGSAAPSTTVAYQLWADTTAGLLKQRNAANTGWLVRGTLAETLVLARSSNTILGVGDYGRTIAATSTFTQTLTAAATLGDGWWIEYRNDGTGIITLDPNSAETIDGAATLLLQPGEGVVINCNGSAFKTVGKQTGWVLLASATASSSAQLDFTNLTGYAAYKFVLSNIIPATDIVGLYLRISQDNGSSFKSGATDYLYAFDGYDTGAARVQANSAGAAQIVVMGNVSNDANNGVSGEILSSDLAAGKRPFFTSIGSAYRSSGARNVFFGTGLYATDGTTVNAVRFLMSSGNIASGTIKVYGLRA